MKKIFIILLFLFSCIDLRAQNPVVVTQPYKFQKWVHVAGSLFSDSTLLNTDSSNRVATTAWMKRNYAATSEPNSILSGLGMSVVSSTLTVQPGTWQINNTVYSKGTSTNFTLVTRDSILSCYETVYATTSNTIGIAVGSFSATPVEPSIPPNTIRVGAVLITPTGTVVYPPLPSTAYIQANPSALQNVQFVVRKGSLDTLIILTPTGSYQFPAYLPTSGQSLFYGPTGQVNWATPNVNGVGYGLYLSSNNAIADTTKLATPWSIRDSLLAHAAAFDKNFRIASDSVHLADTITKAKWVFKNGSSYVTFSDTGIHLGSGTDTTRRYFYVDRMVSGEKVQGRLAVTSINGGGVIIYTNGPPSNPKTPVLLLGLNRNWPEYSPNANSVTPIRVWTSFSDSLNRSEIITSITGGTFNYATGALNITGGGGSVITDSGISGTGVSGDPIILGGNPLTSFTNIDMGGNSFQVSNNVSGSSNINMSVNTTSFVRNVRLPISGLNWAGQEELDPDGYFLSISKPGATIRMDLNIASQAFLFTDSFYSKGAVYAGNYGANFTARSLVDKGYVDSTITTHGSGYAPAFTVTSPITYSSNVIGITQATTSTGGYLTSTDWNTFNGKQAAGNYITALTGDVSASGPGSASATVNQINGITKSYYDPTSSIQTQLNGKQGTITLTTTGTSGAATLVGNTLNIPQYTGTTYTATNGLTLSGTQFKLGGSLTGATTIQAGASNNFVSNSISGSNTASWQLLSGILKNTIQVTSNGLAQTQYFASGSSPILQMFYQNNSSVAKTLEFSPRNNGAYLTDNIDSLGFLYGADYSVKQRLQRQSVPSVLTVIQLADSVKSTISGYAPAFTVTSPITYSSNVIGITQAATSTNGYLSSTDWNTFNGKQAALVSGTNIKTINSVSLLGSGNIVISGSTQVYSEIPTGTINGSNTSFTIAHTPLAGISLFLNGLMIIPTTDYSVSGTTITMVIAPVSGDNLMVNYSY